MYISNNLRIQILLQGSTRGGTSVAGTTCPEFNPCVTRSLVLCVWFLDRNLTFCPFLIWPLCCLTFDMLILITPLESSNYFYSLLFNIGLRQRQAPGIVIGIWSWRKNHNPDEQNRQNITNGIQMTVKKTKYYNSGRRNRPVKRATIPIKVSSWS